MADDLKIKVTIQGDDNLSGPAKSASKSLDGLNKSADNTTKSSGKAADSVNVLAHGLAGPVVAGATAVAGGLAYAVSKAEEFEKTLSGVKAVTGASTAEMKQLSDLALELGATTSFSATEAAQAIGELAKGGVSVSDIMNGAAKATLNLAAASGEKAAPAAALAANAMALFNIEGEHTAEVANAVAGFANATTGSMNDFKFALSSVGAVAKLTGQEFDQTAVALAIMGKAGVLGSDAGTSLRAMLNTLVPSTKAATAAMQELGLITAEGQNQFLDAAGNFKDLRDISDILNQSLQGLSESEKATYLESIFLQDGMKAATLLAEAGAEGFDHMTTAVLGTVTAEEVATEMTNNLAGSQDAMNGSLETAAITLGLELLPAIREVTEALGKFINDHVIPFVKVYGPGLGQALRETAQFLGMVADALSPLIGPVGAAFKSMLDTWGAGLDLVIAGIFNAVVAFANLASAVGEFFDAVGTKARAALDGLKGMIDSLAPTLGAAAQNLGASITNGIVAGINPGVVIGKLQSLAADALKAAKDKVEAHSPSELFAREVGLPIALGIVAGLEEGEPQVTEAINTLLGRGLAGAAAYVKQWSETPAAAEIPAALQLTLGQGLRGVATYIRQWGAGEGTAAMVEAVEVTLGAGLRGVAAFVKEWSQGPEAAGVAQAFWAGLLSYDPRYMLEASLLKPATFKGALDQSLYGGGGKATGGSPWLIQNPNQAIIGFNQGVAQLIAATELKKKFGDLGATAWNSFIEGIKTGTLEAGNQAGQALQRVIDAAKAAGVPQWQQLGTDLMTAFQASLVEGTEISRQKVADLLALAQTAVEAAQKIKDVAAKPDQSYGAGTGGGGTGGTGGGTAHTVQTLPQLGIKAMAAGGLITRPTFALLGERGPEMVTPMGRGRTPLVIENYVMLDGQVIARSTRTVERQRALAGPSHGIGGL